MSEDLVNGMAFIVQFERSAPKDTVICIAVKDFGAVQARNVSSKGIGEGLGQVVREN